MVAMNCTKLDLSYDVMKLPWNLSNLRLSDLLLVKQVFQYAKKTLNHSLVLFKIESLKIVYVILIAHYC